MYLRDKGDDDWRRYSYGVVDVCRARSTAPLLSSAQRAHDVSTSGDLASLQLTPFLDSRTGTQQQPHPLYDVVPQEQQSADMYVDMRSDNIGRALIRVSSRLPLHGHRRAAVVR